MSEAPEKNFRDVENDLMAAIAADLESTDDEPVTVTSYLVIAETMDSEGNMTTKWTSMDGMPYYRCLGMTEWLKINLVHAITRRHDE